MGRRIERSIEIAVPADRVWEALTDPREITRWVSLKARVEPGPGGSAPSYGTGRPRAPASRAAGAV